MADEKNVSLAKNGKKGNANAANNVTDAVSAESKLKDAMDLIGRASAEAKARKSEQDKNQKRREDEAKLRAEENKLRRANDERQARLVAEQRMEALAYAENYRKRMVRDQKRTADAKKALAEEKRAEEEALLREKRASELAALVEKEKKEAEERAAKANALLEKIAEAKDNAKEIASADTAEAESNDVEAPAPESSYAETTPPADSASDMSAEDGDDDFVISISDSEDSGLDDDGQLFIDPESEGDEDTVVLKLDENGECAEESYPETQSFDEDEDYRRYCDQVRAAQQYAQYMDDMQRRNNAQNEASKLREQDAERKMKEAEARRAAEFEEKMNRIDGILRKYEDAHLSALAELVNSISKKAQDESAAPMASSPEAVSAPVASGAVMDQPENTVLTELEAPDRPAASVVETFDSDDSGIADNTDTAAEDESGIADNTDSAAEDDSVVFADPDWQEAEAQSDEEQTVVHRLITSQDSATKVVREEEHSADEAYEDVASESLEDGESAAAIVETQRKNVRDLGFERAIEYMDKEMLPSYLAKNDRASAKLASKVSKTEKKQVKTGDKGTAAGMLVDCLNAQKRIIDIECDSLNNCCYVGTKRGIARYEKRVDMAVVDYNRLADDYENLCGGRVKRASLTTSDTVIAGELPEALPILSYHTEDVAVISESAAEPVSPFNKQNAASAFDKKSAMALIASNEKEIKKLKSSIEKLTAKKKKLDGSDRTECIVETICIQRSIVELYCADLTASCSLGKTKLMRKFSDTLTSEIAAYNAYAEEYEYFTSNTITRADVDIPHKIVSGESYTPIPVITYTREDIGVVSEGERASRQAIYAMDKRLLERYLAASREQERKLRHNFRRLEKERAKAKSDESKAECIVASLTAKKQIIDLLCRNLENAVAVYKGKRNKYAKRLKKALASDIQDYNKIVDEYEGLFNDTLTRADEAVADNIINGKAYAVLPVLTYIKDDPTVEPDALTAKRAAAVTGIIDRKNFHGYALTLDKKLAKLTKEYRKLEKKLEKAKGREDKAECIVKCLTARRLMIELLCDGLDTACGVSYGRFVKKYKKKLTKYAVEYNNLVDVYEDSFNDILTRASEEIADDIIAGKDYEIPPVLTYHRNDIKETKASRRENRSMRMANAMERRRLPKYFLANDKKIKDINKKLEDTKRAYSKAITDEDRAECTVKRLTYIKSIVDINCDSLEVACHYKVKKYIKRFKNAIIASVYSYNETVEEYESVFNDTLTRASASIADDIIAGKEYTPIPELSYNRVVPEESARAFAIVTMSVNRRRIPKLLHSNDKEVKRLCYQLKKLDKKKKRLKNKRDKAQMSVNCLGVQKEIVEIQCDSLSGSCYAKFRRYIKRYKKALAEAVAGYNKYVDEYALVTGETLTKAPATLPNDITLGRRYMPLPTLTFNSSVFDAEDANERLAARRELRRPQMSISRDVVAQGRLERQIKAQSDKDLTVITKYATHAISMLETERDLKRVNFGPETAKDRRSGNDIAKKIKKIKRWHKEALSYEQADNKRYYEIVSQDPQTVKVKRKRADRDQLASLRARLVELLNERDELNGKLVAIYTGEDVDLAGAPVGAKYRDVQNKAANKSYKKQKAMAKAVKGLHVTVDEKERIYSLMNKKTQLEANLDLYLYKIKKEKCTAAVKKQLNKDIRNTRRELKRTDSDIKYLLKRAKSRDAKTRGGSWSLIWGLMLLLFIIGIVAVIYFFGDQIAPLLSGLTGGNAS